MALRPRPYEWNRLDAFALKLAFGEGVNAVGDPMTDYKVEHCHDGMRYRADRKGARWDFVKYAACDIDACDDCGRILPASSMHYASLPFMNRGKRGDVAAFRADPINMMSSRFVCLGCSNRYRALDERLRMHREIAGLIRTLEKEARRAAA